MKRTFLLLFILVIFEEQNAQFVVNPSTPNSNTIYTNGKVGINTTNPIAPLHVLGEIRSQNGSSGGYSTLNTGGSGITGFTEYHTGQSLIGYIGWSSAHMRYVAFGQAGHTFETNGVERMLIKNDGNIGIGTNSPNNQHGWGKVLDVYSSGGSSKILSSANSNSNEVRVGIVSFPENSTV